MFIMLIERNLERWSTRPTVVYGAITVSSWSCPQLFAPFAASTPITLNGIAPMRMVAPTASSPSSKRLALTVVPITQTRAQARCSDSSKNLPSAMFQLRISGMS